ncbi:hypothetical protein [Paenibacillus campi]|uniref:hypothetical protein n=1 Tax=Paenibacillus campi TaxID=3106031 RepID=UPI002AFE982F|nr:hypothetical protein [Paenibacillus sp. SGZ-1014]
MAFGIKRAELQQWKRKVDAGEIAFLTHYWIDDRFPGIRTVTKVGCADIDKLRRWCKSYGLNPRYMHLRDQYPHFDLLGAEQVRILQAEGVQEQIDRFRLDSSASSS